MADENQLDGIADLTSKAKGSLGQNIGQLQQLMMHSGEFKKAAKFFDTVPELPAEEGRNFLKMMEHIKHACDSYGQVLGGARRYVISAKAFSKDTVNFTTDVQKDDLEPGDIEDVFSDFTDSIDKMKESSREVEALKENFKSVLMRLRTAQAEAESERVRGKEKAGSKRPHAGATFLGTIASFLGIEFPFKSSNDAETSKEWEEALDSVLRRLDEVYSILDSMRDECTSALDQLSHGIKGIVDKSKAMADWKNPAKSKHMKEKCIRLGEESAELERACIEYMRADDKIRGIAGAMNRLSME
ncbi:PREDICTED: uncharacterized protein LOC109474450 [Branchiostoma belcheri]|uniref:Uncharacterized protein LOC109474450 n=1 Tax=Branchiostoma belcheri TaxID=7741 RepID=A0A6P4Z198_BRABE|nr:PREDICTED: uncharacterized protein LOC109474450 [Branchiostoma belcheri]